MPELRCACCNNLRDDAISMLSRRDVAICPDCLGWLVGRREHREDAAGRVRLVRAEPIFAVHDLERAVQRYERLGFSVERYDANYAFARRQRLTIHLAQEGDDVADGLYLHVSDADELADEWRLAGLEVEAPARTAWDKHEGAHVDPDGHRIRFGSPVPD